MESVVIGSLVFLSSIIYDKIFGKKVKLNYCRILMQIQNSFIEWLLVCEAVEGGGVFKEIILLYYRPRKVKPHRGGQKIKESACGDAKERQCPVIDDHMIRAEVV